MSSKKKGTATTNLPALRIGSRVRFRDDGVAGRITWANAVSVKIKWDDGEEVTWRRDALANKPIEFLDADAAGGDDQQAEPPAASGQAAAEQPHAETGALSITVGQASATEASSAGPAPLDQEQTPTELPGAAALAQDPPQATPLIDSEPAAEKPRRRRKAPAEPKEKKVSALDAVVRVLAEENRPMTCNEMIEAIAAKGYWASPKGATPAATLYSAILRELTTKGSAARFVKADRGKFARNAGA